MSDGSMPVTEKKLKAALENYPTKADLKEALKNHPTKSDLKEALKNNNNELLEMFSVIMKEFDDRDKSRSEDIKHYLGVLVEEAEERFLKTGHDEISVCEDRLDDHNTRLAKLETVVF